MCGSIGFELCHNVWVSPNLQSEREFEFAMLNATRKSQGTNANDECDTTGTYSSNSCSIWQSLPSLHSGVVTK